jgi:uncharacterized protein
LLEEGLSPFPFSFSPFYKRFTTAKVSAVLPLALAILLLVPSLLALPQPAAAAVAAAATGSRPGYIYDRAQVMDEKLEKATDSYLRRLDEATTAEIVIYTIPSFQGHGIKKGNTEVQDRDGLANYIFNEVSLDGVTGIGKKGKDNGVLILLSLQRDAAGGSMRIEIERGLEGTITDGLAGEILDRYLVPAYRAYEETGSMGALGAALGDTARAVGYYIAQQDPEAKRTVAAEAPTKEVIARIEKELNEKQEARNFWALVIFGSFIAGVGVLAYLNDRTKGRVLRILRALGRATPSRGFFRPNGGRREGDGGGGSGGGGGGSGGGGAGR